MKYGRPTVLDALRAERRTWNINPRTRIKQGKKGGKYRRAREKTTLRRLPD